MIITLPSFCTLDGVSEISRSLEGVELKALNACDTIYVRTYNSDYEIFVLDPATGRALVRGGKYLVESTEATVRGSTFGGCMLKAGWLGVGLRMEINTGHQFLTTTPVENLRVEPMNKDARAAQHTTAAAGLH